MRKCPSCDAEYAIGDAICANCGAELPAPYETWEDGNEADEVTERLAVAGGESWVEIGAVPPSAAAHFAQQLSWAGIRHQLYPPMDAPQFSRLAETGGQVRLLVPESQAPAAWQVLSRATLTPAQTTILSGAEVFLGETTFNPGTVVLAEGRIIEVLNFALPDPQDGSTFIDLTGDILAAGFIDVHTHGMRGIDVNTAAPEDFRRLSLAAAEYGLTTLIPTTVACAPDELRRVLENLRLAQEQGLPGARLPGLHLESNFISPQFKGAQPLEWLFAPNDARAQEITPILDEYAALLPLVTLAPELPGALDLIGWLCEHDIVASMGHSAATYDEAIAAIEAGATHATHLFNAMPPLHHRQPGLVGAALERDEVFTEVVCDGIHIHPAVVAAVISAKGAERFVPVSDSLRAAGMSTGELTLGGQRVTVTDGVARLENGTIAGSVTTMDAIARFLVSQVGWDLGEALTMAATTPADSLAREDLGRIAQGAAADLVVLDQDLQVRMTLVDGKVVYRR